MNKVFLIGRLVKNPEGERGTKKTNGFARFTLALNRGKDKDGNELGADFPQVVCFGNLADIVLEYCEKGKQVAVSGSIKTGSYEDKNHNKVYTTDVIADRVEFLGSKE